MFVKVELEVKVWYSSYLVFDHQLKLSEFFALDLLSFSSRFIAWRFKGVNVQGNQTAEWLKELQEGLNG